MIDYSRLALPKPTPRAVDRLEAKRQRQQAERDCRAAVRARDRGECFFPGCRRPSANLHHLVPSSIRGKRLWLTSDIVSTCLDHHRWIHAGLIEITGNPDEGPVRVTLTKLGQDTRLQIPKRR